MGSGSGIPPARARALPPPTLPLAFAAMLLLAMLAMAKADQVPARVEEEANARTGRGVSTPKVRRFFQDRCAVSGPTAPDRRPGDVLDTLLRPRAGGLPAANPVPGTEFTLTPSVQMQVLHDNNVMFRDVSDQETKVSPQLEGRLRTERTTLTLRAAADVLRYARYVEFDRVNHELSVALQHAATESMGIEVRGNTRSDHTFESALDDAGVVAVKNPHSVYRIKPALTYRLDELTRVRLGCEAAANRYPNRRKNDARTRGASLDLARDLKSRTATLLARTGFTSTAYDTGVQDTASLAGGLEWKITETLSCLLSAGPSVSRDRFSARAHDETHLDLAGEGHLRMKLERAEADLGVDMGALPGPGGEDTFRRRLLGAALFHLTERLDATLKGAWYRSRTRSLVRTQDNTVVDLSPGLEYALSEHARLRLGYDYTCIDDHVAEVYRQRQQIFLSLHLEYPRTFR